MIRGFLSSNMSTSGTNLYSGHECMGRNAVKGLLLQLELRNTHIAVNPSHFMAKNSRSFHSTVDKEGDDARYSSVFVLDAQDS